MHKLGYDETDLAAVLSVFAGCVASNRHYFQRRNKLCAELAVAQNVHQRTTDLGAELVTKIENLFADGTVPSLIADAESAPELLRETVAACAAWVEVVFGRMSEVGALANAPAEQRAVAEARLASAQRAMQGLADRATALAAIVPAAAPEEVPAAA